MSIRAAQVTSTPPQPLPASTGESVGTFVRRFTAVATVARIPPALPRSPWVGLLLATLAGLAVGAVGANTTIPVLASVVFLVAATVVVLRWPLAGVLLFALVATLLPFGVLAIRLVFAPTLVDVVLTLVLLAWVLRVLSGNRPLVPTAVDGLLLLFVGLAVTSLVLGTGYAPLPAEDLRLFLKMLSSMLFFFGVVQIVRCPAQVARVVQALIIGGGVAALLALGLYVLPNDTAIEVLSTLGAVGYPTGPDVLRNVAGTETLRATGTSVDPNVLGGLLMVTTLLTAAQLIAPRPPLPRLGLALIAAPMLGALALTYSRTSWVGLAAGVLFLVVFRDRRLLIVVVAAALALAVLPQTQQFVARFSEAVELRDQATLMRLDEYRNALVIIGNYPLFGIGFGGAPRIELAVGVSSVYLMVAEQMGLIGLALFVALLAMVAVRCLGRPSSENAARAGVTTGLQAAFVGAVVAGLFDHYFYNLRFPHMVALFWLLVGLLVVTTRPAPPSVVDALDSASTPHVQL